MDAIDSMLNWALYSDPRIVALLGVSALLFGLGVVASLLALASSRMEEWQAMVTPAPEIVTWDDFLRTDAR